MIDYMEISRRTWTAAVKLAVVLSVLAAGIAIAASSTLTELPTALVIVPVMVVAFSASWIQTERIRRRAIADMVIMPVRFSA